MSYFPGYDNEACENCGKSSCNGNSCRKAWTSADSRNAYIQEAKDRVHSYPPPPKPPAPPPCKPTHTIMEFVGRKNNFTIPCCFDGAW